MPDRVLAVSMPFEMCTPRESVEIVSRARDLGYTAAWASEITGPDAFTILGAVAARSDLDLGVAVVPAQTRTAFVLGMSAVSLAHLTGGKFSLGIGASSEVLVSRFGGQPFDKPLSHVREVVEALRPILAGERSTFEGDFVSIGGYKPAIPPPAPVPLFLGSLNPKSLRMAGELADGLCVNQVAARNVPIMLDELHKGAADAGRALPDDFPVMARLFCAVTDQVEFTREALRATFAPYAATSVYNRFFKWMGYQEEADAIAAAAAAGDKAGINAAYSDRMLDDFFLVGDADYVADRINQYYDAGITIAAVHPVAIGAPAVEEMLAAIGQRIGGR